MRALSPPFARAVAVAILVVLVAAVYFGAVQPLIDSYRSSRATEARLETELARYERVAQELAPRRAELAALKQRQTAQDGFLEGSNETLVAAQLQNRIKSLVAAGEGELVSAEILPAQEDGNFRRIGVRGQLSITMPGALRVIHGLEAASPLLFLDNVELRGQPEIRRRIATAQPAFSVVEVRFDVYGFMRGEPHEAAPGAPPAPGRRR